MPTWTKADQQFMLLALSLATRGEGYVEPNPMVGCVLIKGGQIVGRGWHRKYGGPHAEVNALRDAGAAARGATAYVTLEPCNHFGKTPPCTDALIEAGVKRVVIATRDSNPIVAGRGIRRLRQMRIRVEVGLLKREAEELIAPFRRSHIDKRPYVILKWAQSIDGKIATRTGDSKWITSPQSRAAAHEIRARVDGIIVGVNTVIADDPELTARLAKPRRMATRIVLDSTLRTPLRSRLVRTADQIPTLIVANEKVVTKDRSFSGRRKRLEAKGCEIIVIPSDKHGCCIDLHPLLSCLCERGMTNVMVEGGGQVLGSFLEAGLADEARIFVGAKIIGGEMAPGPLRNWGPASMSDLPYARITKVAPLGPDMCYTLIFHY